MRHIPPSLDPVVVAQIDGRLDGIERDDGVRILWAIESGSRAWGRLSPLDHRMGECGAVRRGAA
jgi:hypothetical protein